MIKEIYNTLTKNINSVRLMQYIGLIGLTTWIHHVYGGIVYDTPYRIIVPSLSLPIFWIITYYVQFLYLKKQSKTIKYLFISIVLILWVIPIGFIEGGYNHILKNILFFTGVSQEKLATLFPPEFGALRLFEKPNDIIFEMTGIIQFFIGIMIVYFLRKFGKTTLTKTY